MIRTASASRLVGISLRSRLTKLTVPLDMLGLALMFVGVSGFVTARHWVAPFEVLITRQRRRDATVAD